MTREEIRAAVLAALGDVAPEVDLGRLDGAAVLRDVLEIDSMDFLNFVVGIHRRTGVEVPEADYPKLASVDGCVAYLTSRLGA